MRRESRPASVKPARIPVVRMTSSDGQSFRRLRGALQPPVRTARGQASRPPAFCPTVVHMHRNPKEHRRADRPPRTAVLPAGTTFGRELLILIGLLVTSVGLGRRCQTSSSSPSSYRDPERDGEHPHSGAAHGALRIDVLGAVRISTLDAPLSEFGRALVCYLALHPDRPQTADDIQTALWPTVGPQGDVSRKTFLNNVSQVRGAIGRRHLPIAKGRPAYELCGVDCDWSEFLSLVDQAERDGTHRLALLERALQLVRGVPLEAELSRYYHWADFDGTRARIERTVIWASTTLAALAIEESDPDLAAWSLRQGLRSSPYDLALWSKLLQAIDCRDEAGEQERCWREACAVLDDDAIRRLRDEPSPPTHREPR